MDVNIEEIVFESLENFPKLLVEIPEEVSEEIRPIMKQFLESGYFNRNGLCIDRFLDEEKTIDLEKLELAIKLTVEYLEKSVKIENPIYVFIRNMDVYFNHRSINVKDIGRVVEESSFILGFCSALFEELQSTKEFIVSFSV